MNGHDCPGFFRDKTGYGGFVQVEGYWIYVSENWNYSS